MANQEEIPSFNHIPTWLERNKDAFSPPVCNKLMHGPDGQLFVMFVGGPNQRKDFHIEEGEELFYMVKGEMSLKVQEKGKFKEIRIKKGEIFLLPSRIPHSPQRSADTIGLVIERQRLPEEKDCIRYFTEDQSNILFEKWIFCENLGIQISSVIKEFFASEENATGKPTATSIEPRPSFLPDTERDLGQPFSLEAWLEENKEKIENFGKIRIFSEKKFQTDVFVFGGKKEEKFSGNQNAEFWIWQIKGEANLIYEEGDETDLESRNYHFVEETSFLLPRGKSFILQPVENTLANSPSYTMVVMMDPANKARVEK